MRNNQLKIYKIYIALILILFLIIIKIIVDFYIYSPSKPLKNKINFKIEKNIITPRFQSNDDGLTYIKADIGYIDEDKNYIFKNATLKSIYGDATSGEIKITKDRNNIIFTESPIWNININKVKNKKNIFNNKID